jgi:hypothetical protein
MESAHDVRSGASDFVKKKIANKTEQVIAIFVAEFQAIKGEERRDLLFAGANSGRQGTLLTGHWCLMKVKLLCFAKCFR